MPHADIAPEGCTHHHEPEIWVTTRWNDKELIKQIPGAHWVAAEKLWHVRLTWAAVVQLRGVFGSSFTFDPDGALAAWMWERRHTYVDPGMALRELISDDRIVKLDKRLYPFQSIGVHFMLAAQNVLLADEMGTGKTIQTLIMLREQHARDGDALPALIICPNGVKHHWASRMPDWFPEATPYVLEKGTANMRKTLATARHDPTAIVIVNIESVRNLSRGAPYGSVKLKRCQGCDPKWGDDIPATRCEVHPKELNSFGFQTCVLDEAHRVKEPKAKQTRAVWATFHDPSVRRRIALTGTPIANHPGDLWPILHAIDPRSFPVKGAFMERYALTAWNAFGGHDVVGVRPDTKDELFRIIDPMMRRMLKEIVLPQLPAKIREVRRVEMTPAQRRMYTELDRKLATRLEDGELFAAPNQLVKHGRLSQFAAATVEVIKPDEDDISTWQVNLKNPSPKLDELELILQELGDAPCVISAVSRKLIELAAFRLGELRIPHALITGAVHPYERQEALKMLAARQVRVVLFTVAAGGEGLDMSSVDTLINLQRSWSMVQDMQTENRVHRIGSERHQAIRIIDVITSDTVEEEQIERVHEKYRRLDELTRDQQQLRRAGVTSGDPRIEALNHEEAELMTDPYPGIPYEEEE